MNSCGWEGSSLISFLSLPHPLKSCFALTMELWRWGVGPCLSQELQGTSRRDTRDEALSVTSPFPPALLKGVCHGGTAHDGVRRKHLLVSPPPRPSAPNGGPREAGHAIPSSACSAGGTDGPLRGLHMSSQLRALISPKAANCLMGKRDANYKALSSTDSWHCLLLTPHWSSHRVDGRSILPHSEKGVTTAFVSFTEEQC